MIYIQSILLKIKTVLPTAAIIVGFTIMAITFAVALINWHTNAFFELSWLEVVGGVLVVTGTHYCKEKAASDDNHR